MKRVDGNAGEGPLPSLEGLFSRVVHVASAPIADHRAALLPGEREGIERASLARQCEFATGRWLGRKLLWDLGETAVEIGRNADRTPRWPAGWVGSITHSGNGCVVAVARARDLLGLGIDLEPDRAVKPGLERLVCFGDELDWIAEAGAAEVGRRCRLVFSAKEAVYKAFHPLIRRVWRFEEVALRIELERGEFEARLPADAGRAVIGGRILCRGGWIVSGVEWRADDRSLPAGPDHADGSVDRCPAAALVSRP